MCQNANILLTHKFFCRSYKMYVLTILSAKDCLVFSGLSLACINFSKRGVWIALGENLLNTFSNFIYSHSIPHLYIAQPRDYKTVLCFIKLSMNIIPPFNVKCKQVLGSKR